VSDAATPAVPAGALAGVPDGLVLTPVSRWPTTLADDTVRAVLDPSFAAAPDAARPARSDTPVVSVLVVTYQGLVFTRLCLETLLAERCEAPLEVVVVDNGSTDGTRDYLTSLAERDARVRVELGDTNRGFGAATNHAAVLARGRVLLLLNNDTIVPPGAIDALVRRLDTDAALGLLGVVTNRAGNEAEIEVPYRTFGGMRRFASERFESGGAGLFDIRTATLFCAALRREVWDAVGPLDEQFGLGLFEDDDYAMRVRRAGLRVVCDDNVFVHHFGQASIGQLGPTLEYGSLFAANRARWESKWGETWKPFERRPKTGYAALVARIGALVAGIVPADATVAVISKGDEAILQVLAPRVARHYPQAGDGGYAGHYPANGADAVRALELVHARGAAWLVVPAPAQWWLTHYPELGAWLAAHAQRRLSCDDCDVFELGPVPAVSAGVSC
jgi:GT2 family glycosyltransferase